MQYFFVWKDVMREATSEWDFEAVFCKEWFWYFGFSGVFETVIDGILMVGENSMLGLPIQYLRSAI